MVGHANTRMNFLCHVKKRNTKSYLPQFGQYSRVAQGAYLEVEYIRNVLSVSGTLKYADSGTA